MRQYQTLLGIPDEAWDVYFLYPPDARWTDSLPPRPSFWMHQLGSLHGPNEPAPLLDPDEFARRANALLVGPQSTQPRGTP